MQQAPEASSWQALFIANCWKSIWGPLCCLQATFYFPPIDQADERFMRPASVVNC